MILIVCVDDIMGMAFNRRRQSRDSLLCADIAAEAKGAAIWMDERSALLFKDTEANIHTEGGFESKAGVGEYCFLEFSSPAALEHKAEKIILYRWNRRYQSDLKFDIDLDRWQMESSTDFPGSSHENITKEVYTHE